MTRIVGHAGGILCVLVMALGATTHRVSQSDNELIRLIIAPSVDDSVWCGWIGLPPKAEVTRSEAEAAGGIRPVPWSPSPQLGNTPSVHVGPVGLLRYHRVVPVRVTLASQTKDGAPGLPVEVVVSLWLRGASRAAPHRPGFDTLLPGLVVNWDQAREWTEAVEVPDPPEKVPAPSVKAPIRDEGLYRLTYEDLHPVTPGSDELDTRRIALWNRGELVPIRVISATTTWQPGDWIEFYAHGAWREDPQGRWSPKESKYTRDSPYYFVWDAIDPPRMHDADAASEGMTPAAFGWWFSHREVDSFPSISGHRGAIDDEWYWGGPFYPGEVARSFNISNLFLDGPRARVRARFMAISDDTTVAMDHAVTLLVNGAAVGSASWGGYGAQIVDGADAVLQGGQNEFIIQSTGISISGLQLDYFAVLYPRLYKASSGQTVFSPSASGTPEYQISGLISGVAVDVFEAPASVRLTRFSNVPGSDGTIRFRHDFADTSRIVVVPETAWKGPADLAAPLSPVLPRPLVADPSRRAQYLIVYGADELEAAVGFGDFHLSRGEAASADIVSVDDVWDEFSFGMLNPHGLRHFLQWALVNWADPPEFVLLLGDGTWDYNGYLGPGKSANIVPSFGNPASDNFYASLNDTSFYPDIYLGRIPALSAAQAVTALAKAQAYSASPAFDAWRKRTLFITGGATASDFSLYDLWVSLLYNMFIKTPPFLGALSTVAKDVEGYWPGVYNSTVRAAIDSGCIIVNFFGHGASGTWDYMLDSEDAALLQNGTRMPFILSPTCFTGDFADPRDTVFAEHFLRLDDTQHGAIGFFGSSGTSYLAEGFEYAWAMFSQLFGQGDPRLGPATTSAKLSSWPWPTHVDSIMASVYNLLGDPLLALVFPTEPDLHIDDASVSFAPSEPAASDSIAMLLSVTNEGIAWPSPVVAEVEREGAIVASASFTPDSLSSRVLLRWQAGPSPGAEILLVRLDPDGTLPDPDASDNDLQVHLTLLRPRPEPLMPTNDAMVPGPSVALIAAPVGDEAHYFQVASSDTFGAAILDSSTATLPQGATVAWSWQAPSQGAFCWRIRVDGGAWSLPRWFTVRPPEEGWAQSQPAQFSGLERFRCEASALGLSLEETASSRDYATLAEGATVSESDVSSLNPSACGPENLVGGTTINTDWGGSFYFSRLDEDQWAIVDLGQERIVKRLASAHETQPVTKRAVWSYFGIESSTDGFEFTDWGHTPDYTDSGYGAWIASYVAYEKPDPMPVRYIRYRYGKCYPFGPVYEGARVYEVYAFPAQYPDSGWALSPTIGPAASWLSLSSEGATPPGASAVIRILVPGTGDSWDIAGAANLGTAAALSWLSAAEHPTVRIQASFLSPARDVTPRMTSWQVAYTTIPDLAVDPDTVLVSPPLPEPGASATVQVRIVNAGSAPVPSARYRVAVEEAGQESRVLEQSLTGWLAPGTAQSLEVAWQAVPGVSHFTLTLDPYDDIAEANEGNNTAFGEARVLGNLAWGDTVMLMPSSPAPGESLTISATAHNDGVLTLGQTMASAVWSGVVDTAWAQVPPLAPGQVADLQFRTMAPNLQADTAVLLTLDPDTLLIEVSRADNARLVPVSITQLADPAIAAAVADCPTPPLGDPFAIILSIVNYGGRPTGDMEVALSQIGGWTERIAVPPLAPHESTTVSAPWPTGDETAVLSFLFVLDPDSLVADGDRTNNTAALEVSTQRAPDLLCTAWEVQPPLPVAGTAATLLTSIRNRSIDVAPGFTVVLTDSTGADTHRVPGLDGQRTTNLLWYLSPSAPGVMGLTLEIDSDEEVAEACENNNVLFVAVSIATPWDLAVTEADLQRVDPSQPFVSWDSLAVAITVHNEGDETSPPALVECYDGLPEASGILWRSLQTDSIAPHASQTLGAWWPSGTTPGFHVMAVLIDPKEELAEWHRSNNRATRTIEVLADTIPPEVEIAPPWAGFQEEGYLTVEDTLRVRAWDAASGVTSLSLLLDGAPVTCPPTSPDTSAGIPGIMVRTPALGMAGPHTLTARATDRAGMAREAELSYTISGGLVLTDVAAVPSPASGPTWITAKVSMPGDLRIGIYTPSGRLIRLLEASVAHPSRAGAQWDLLDQDGDRVANGVYLVHMVLWRLDGSAQGKGSLVVRR
ncbi:hypothetical protein JXA88_13225 [Candidatus Fermentibacteria bacterium]|nr:hypothetical protein [Candidatus Fermentibacteria bacterium]